MREAGLVCRGGGHPKFWGPAVDGAPVSHLAHPAPAVHSGQLGRFCLHIECTPNTRSPLAAPCLEITLGCLPTLTFHPSSRGRGLWRNRESGKPPLMSLRGLEWGLPAPVISAAPGTSLSPSEPQFSSAVKGGCW